MTDTPSSFEPVLALLAEAMREAEPLQDRLQDVQDRIASYRDTLQAMMQQAAVKTIEGHGLLVTRASRSTTVITNRADLEAALRESSLWEQCIRLDLAEAKKAGLQIEAPGVEKRPIEVFVVKHAKE